MTLKSVFVRTFSTVSLFIICLAATLHPAVAQDQVYRYDTIALTGEPLPGTGGAGADIFSAFDLNSSGELIVVGDWWALTEEESGSGLWLWRQGVLTPVAVSETAVPGVAGEVFGVMSGNSPRLNAAGNVAFITRGSSSAPFRPSLYTGTPGSLSLVARVGEPALGAGGLLFETLDLSGASSAGGGAGPFFILLYGPSLNNNGDFVFMAHLADCIECGVPAVREDGLWLNTANGLQLLALTGDPAPGITGSTLAKFLHYSLNDAGQIAFRALLDDTTSGDQGLWIGTPGNFSLIAKTGDEAPGTGGLSFTGFASEGEFGPALRASGEFLFRAFVNSGGPNNDSGLWLFRNGTLEPIVRTGESAPGATGAIFESLDRSLVNDSGAVAFRAILPATLPDKDEGIWRGFPETPDLVARTGDPAPGTAGRTFDSFSGLGLNESGEIAFGAQVHPFFIEYGAWVASGTNVSPVIYPGQVLEVRPGDFRTVRSAFFLGNLNSEGGLINSFNDAGQVMVTVDFNDWTSGVLLATPVDPMADQPPVANAGPDQVVFSADSVVLDGTGSHDPEGGPLTYLWSLYGAEIATGPTPTVGPFAVGTYSIVLTVTDQAGLQWSDTMSLTVRPPNMPPLADAGPDQTVNGSQLVTLNGLGSSDPEGEALSYVWTLDGASAGTSATVTVGPLSVGTHIATLTVTDPQGASASDSLTISVVNGTPIAQAGPDLTVNHATIVNLDGSGSQDPDGDSLDFIWSLDGVQIGTGATAAVGPLEPGSYTIVLTVTDPLGASATDSLVVTAINEPPVADAGADQTVSSSSAVLLDGSGSSDPEGESLSFTWSLAGQQIASGPTPSVGPFSPGNYTVVLNVTDARGATATDSLVLTVTNTPPVANAGPDQSVQGPQLVALDGTGSSDPDGDALAFTWSLGGQQIASGATPTVGPFGPGLYTILLTVDDGRGTSATDSLVVTVTNTPPVADAGLDQTVQGPEVVTLDGSGSGDPDGNALTYSWSLGGVEVATGVQPNVGPFDEGSYIFTLTVTDPAGATSSDSVTLIVLNAPPIANAGPDQTIITNRRKKRVTLNASASSDLDGTIVSYVWRLNGSVLGNGISIRPRLRRGTNTVVLTVTDDDGASSTDEVVIIIARSTQVSGGD